MGVLPTTPFLSHGTRAARFRGIARWRRDPTGGSYRPGPIPRAASTTTASDRGRLAPHFRHRYGAARPEDFKKATQRVYRSRTLSSSLDLGVLR